MGQSLLSPWWTSLKEDFSVDETKVKYRNTLDMSPKVAGAEFLEAEGAGFFHLGVLLLLMPHVIVRTYFLQAVRTGSPDTSSTF